MATKFRKVSSAVQLDSVKVNTVCLRCLRPFVASSKFARYCPKCKAEVANERPYGKIVKHHLDSGSSSGTLVEHE